MDGLNNDFVGTPFDSLIADLQQSVLGNPTYPLLTPLELFIFSQLKILRAVYLSYSKMGLDNIHTFEFPSNHKLTAQEMLSSTDRGFVIMLNYMSFIDVLNQLGRCLNKPEYSIYREKDNIPCYVEIRFFRNKISEHWDDYTSFKPGGSYISSGAAFPVPIFFGKRPLLAESLALENSIKNEFSKYGIVLGSLSGCYYSDFSEKIYSLLKEINPCLGREPTKKGKNDKTNYIPNSLVSLLFQFEFPLPIYDIEEYCSQLVVYLRTMKLFRGSRRSHR